MPVNIEIKAHCKNPQQVKETLESMDAEYHGLDHQIDTYFNVREDRLKLREGNIENNLIYYHRDNQSGPKKSEVILYPASKDEGLKKILDQTLGIKVVVDKLRHIFFIDNVKFHVDEVKGLGDFVEIEAIGEAGEENKLEQQCRHFMELLHLDNDDLISESYSDLLINRS